MPLRFWINAFIPKTVAGYTRVIPAGKHKGKTAIPLPVLADFNPLNLWKDFSNWFDTGYLTDQRSFDAAPDASVRMRSWVEIDSSTLAVINKGHESSGTTEVDLKTGAELGFKVADMSRCIWTTPRIRPVSTSQSFPGPVFPGSPFGSTALMLELVAQAGDPLVSAAADIDYEGLLVVARASGVLNLSFDGKIDSFPAFESYASLDDKTQSLFNVPPPPDTTVQSLPGSANRPVRGSATFPLRPRI
jgi:hypothetical protein